MSGELLGRYELLSLIGEGAMGTVYRARDTRLERPVAIKVMSAALGKGAEAVARFEREARSMARLQHPYIVHIHDFLDISGNLCLVMELIAGDPLDLVINQHRPISVPAKLAFMAKVCHALDYLHSQGVIHRDLKPSNILMLPDGSPKIVDFGIAKLARDEAGRKLTRTSTRIGTIAYMSPEQFNGEAVDQRTDIFSAGVVLYELLSGISPFEGVHTTATMKKILIDPTPTLPKTVAGVPEEVHQVLAKALAKEAKDRFATAREFASKLEGQPIPVVRATAPKPVSLPSPNQTTGPATLKPLLPPAKPAGPAPAQSVPAFLENYGQDATSSNSGGVFGRIKSMADSVLNSPADPIPADLKYLHKAAELGQAAAQIRLATLYHEGIEVPRDDHKAVHLLRQAANQGSLQALHMLKTLWVWDGPDATVAKLREW